MERDPAICLIRFPLASLSLFFEDPAPARVSAQSFSLASHRPRKECAPSPSLDHFRWWPMRVVQQSSAVVSVSQRTSLAIRALVAYLLVDSKRGHPTSYCTYERLHLLWNIKMSVVHLLWPVGAQAVTALCFCVIPYPAAPLSVYKPATHLQSSAINNEQVGSHRLHYLHFLGVSVSPENLEHGTINRAR